MIFGTSEGHFASLWDADNECSSDWRLEIENLNPVLIIFVPEASSKTLKMLKDIITIIKIQFLNSITSLG